MGGPGLRPAGHGGEEQRHEEVQRVVPHDAGDDVGARRLDAREAGGRGPEVTSLR